MEQHHRHTISCAGPKQAAPRRPSAAARHLSRAADAVVRRRLIALAGWTAILILAGIFVFLVLNSLRAFEEVGLWDMLSGVNWYPTSSNAQFGFLPAEVGSLWVTFVALFASVPVGHRCRDLPLRVR
jgi:ABC-type phosphate transport system permease subunit